VLCVSYSLSDRKSLSSCSGPYMLAEKLGAGRRIMISCTVIVRSGTRIVSSNTHHSQDFLDCMEADNSAPE
jgi:hypothetical protein